MFCWLPISPFARTVVFIAKLNDQVDRGQSLISNGAKPAAGTKFGAELSAALDACNLRQRDLARGMGVADSHVCALVNGRRTASPEMVERVIAALGADAAVSQRLHRAAATDHGFRIDRDETGEAPKVGDTRSRASEVDAA